MLLQVAAVTQEQGTALEHSWWLDGPTKRMIEQSLNLSGVLTFTVREDQHIRMTREQVAQLPHEQFAQVCTLFPQSE